MTFLNKIEDMKNDSKTLWLVNRIYAAYEF